MGAFGLGWEQGERRTEERQGRKDEERQAQLQTIGNAGLTPEQQAEAIRTLYAKDPSALKQHIENLIGRLQRKQPQPTPMAYPAESSQAGGDQQIGSTSLPAPVVNYPGAKTQADKRAQILSGGTTPDQRRQAEIQARSDAQAANKTQPA